MNVKKAIKKMVALGTGSVLMGATVLGAMAADLSNFPEPFVKNGQFDAMIVIGQAAATADVVGAIDIATTLQYEMREAASSGASSSTSVTLSGDNVLIAKNKDMLALGETVTSVLDELDLEDMEALADEEYADEEYSQTIAPKGVVSFKENEDEEVGFYLEFANDAEIFTYELEFDSDLDESETDLEDESIVIMGKEYTVNAVDVATANEIKMTLLGGESTHFLEERASGEFELNGVTYTVEADVVTDVYANIKVNGEAVKIDIGDSEELDIGIEIGVKDTIVDDDYPDVVEFYLGADKIILEDTDVSDSASSDNLVVGDETYNNVEVTIEGTTVLNGDDDDVTISKIKIVLYADDDYDLAAGESLSDYIDGSNEDFLFGNIDMSFEGMTEASSQTVTVDAQDDQYFLEFVTEKGLEYKLPYAYTDGSDNFVLGEEGSAGFLNMSDATNTRVATSVVAADLHYEEDDVILFTDAESNPEDRSGRFLEVTGIDVEAVDLEATIDFNDLAIGGDSYEVTLTTDADGDDEDGVLEGEITLDGEDHIVLMDINDSTTMFYVDNILATTNQDLIGLKGDAFLKINNTIATELNTIGVGIVAESYDETPTYDQLVHVRLTDDNADDEVKISSAFVDVTGVTLADDDYKSGYSDFGIEVTANTADEDIEITIPAAMRTAQVFVTSGAVTRSVVEGAAGSAAYTISPVAAGVAVLDTEATSWKTENVIVVGGPCVNSVAAALMNNPADCAEGFSAGKAMVKLVPQGSKVAMLVAGMSADDTRLATKVVHDYKAHASKFTGMELEVAGTSMSDVTITSMQ